MQRGPVAYGELLQWPLYGWSVWAARPMRRSHAVDWMRYPNGISLVARRPRARDHGCRVALPKDCDAFSWPCSTDDDCRWDASFRSLGPRLCRHAKNPRRRKSRLQPPRHRMGFLQLCRQSHDKKPTCESLPHAPAILTLWRTARNVREDSVEVPEMGERSACYHSFRK